MWWRRLATFTVGAAAVIAGVALGQPALAVAGFAVIGWAVPFPGDGQKKEVNDQTKRK